MSRVWYACENKKGGAMKTLLLSIVLFLAACETNNITQVTQSGCGAFVSQGMIHRQPTTKAYTISLSQINPDIHILNNIIDIYSIQFWSRDTIYGYDTIYTGTFRIERVQVLADSIALYVPDSKSTQAFYRLLCWHK